MAGQAIKHQNCSQPPHTCIVLRSRHSRCWILERYLKAAACTNASSRAFLARDQKHSCIGPSNKHGMTRQTATASVTQTAFLAVYANALQFIPTLKAPATRYAQLQTLRMSPPKHVKCYCCGFSTCICACMYTNVLQLPAPLGTTQPTASCGKLSRAECYSRMLLGVLQLPAPLSTTATTAST